MPWKTHRDPGSSCLSSLPCSITLALSSPLVIFWTMMVASLPSFLSPGRWEKRAEGKEIIFCHFTQEGKPSPLAFAYISLAISSSKGTEINFHSFCERAWQEMRAMNVGSCQSSSSDLKINLSYVITSAYFLKYL